MLKISADSIAGIIDHAVLKPDSTLGDVLEACSLCIQYQTASICVRPSDVPIAVKALQSSSVKVSTVIGFPHGTTTTAAKVAEAEQAAMDGCQEIDMVLNIGRLLSGDFSFVEQDIRAVCAVARRHGMLIKIIFENAYLDDDLIRKACTICTKIGVDFVKTSTEFAGTGATVEDIDLMRSDCPLSIGVKASGGIRTLDDALAVIACGATRIGASSTRSIVDEARRRQSSGTLRAPTTEQALGQDHPKHPDAY